MSTQTLHATVCLSVSLLPVLVFLVALIFLDSYKLVRFRMVVYLILYGSLVAFVCLWLSSWIIQLLNVKMVTFRHYGAPVVEEVLKALAIVFLIRRKRVGFMVDASIAGFAVGAGFAIIENTYYFKSLPDRHLMLWIVRGFGTAIMHSGTTAVVGVVSKYLADRYGSGRFSVFLPGVVVAIVVHSLYNHVFISPTLATIGILVVLPTLITIIFRASEQATRNWLGVRFDTDQELLEMINSGQASRSRIGAYLESLKEHFPGEVVADMLCMIRLHLELSIRAKGILLMTQAGFPVHPEPEVAERFKELKYLERSIGKTGVRAISPIFNMSDRDLWQHHMLQK